MATEQAPSGKLSLKILSENLEKVVEQTNHNMEELEAGQKQTNEKIDALIEAMNQRHEGKIDRGITPSKAFEADTVNLGTARGADPDDRSYPEIEIEGVNYNDKAAELAFMSEMVVVRVNPDNHKDADKRVQIQVNGRSWVMDRGKKYEVPRVVVEGLARAKPVHFGNVLTQNADGADEFEWPASVGLRFPFEVIADKNPRGRPWLEGILAQP